MFCFCVRLFACVSVCVCVSVCGERERVHLYLPFCDTDKCVCGSAQQTQLCVCVCVCVCQPAAWSPVMQDIIDIHTAWVNTLWDIHPLGLSHEMIDFKSYADGFFLRSRRPG